MLTKRVFNAIARELKQVRPENPELYEVWVSAVVAMGRGLEESNPRFDSGRFLAACKKE
jgi:hypothetical protein